MHTFMSQVKGRTDKTYKTYNTYNTDKSYISDTTYTVDPVACLARIITA